MTDLHFRTAKQLASDIRKKKIGCLELLDLYLARVEALSTRELNAIVAMDVEGARKRAKAADAALKAGKKLGPAARRADDDQGVLRRRRAIRRPGAIPRSRTT